MPELETLKWEIENKRLSSNYWVFKTTSGSELEVEESAIRRGNVQTDTNKSGYGLTADKQKLACVGSYDVGI